MLIMKIEMLVIYHFYKQMTR